MDRGNTPSPNSVLRTQRWRNALLLTAVLFISAFMLGTWLTAFAAPAEKPGELFLFRPGAPTDIDLSITKSAVPSIFTVGTNNQYIISVFPSGTITQPVPVIVQDNLPDGITVADPATDIDADAWNCGTSTRRVINCTFTGEIVPGQQLPQITLNLTIASNVAPQVTNTATLIADDSNPGNNQSTITTVVDSVDLELTKSINPTYADVGVPVAYQLAVSNDGPAVARNVSIIDSLPAGMNYDCANSSSIPITGIQCTLIQDTDEYTATWSLPDMPDGQVITLTLPAVPTSSATGENLINTATVTSTNASDWDPLNNTDDAQLFVSGLDIDKTTSRESVFVGDNYIYTIHVVNNGTQTANSVRVRDTFDPALDIVSAAYRINSGSWTSFTTGRNMNRLIGSLAPNHTATVAVTVRGNQTVVISSTVTNTARVTASPSIERPSDVVTTTIQPAADLEVDKSDGPDEITAGESYSYTLYVDNIGSITTTNIIVTDTLSNYLVFTSVDPGDLIITPTFTSTLVRVWEVKGVYSSTEGFDFDIGVRVANNAPPGTRLNNTIRASGTSTETWLANNTFTTEDTLVVEEPKPSDMNINLSRTPSQAEVGGTFRFTVVVKNKGDQAATSVKVYDQFPTVLDITGATTNRGTATTNASTREVTVNVPTLDKNQVLTVTINTRVNSTATGNQEYEHRSKVTWNPNNEELSNIVRYRIVGSSTLPGTGGLAVASMGPLNSLAIGVGLLLVALGIGVLLYSLWSRTRRPLWTAWFGRAGLILLVVGFTLSALGLALRSEAQRQPQLALVSGAQLPLATKPSPTAPPKIKSPSSDDSQEWEPTPTPASLPDYPIPNPPSPTPGSGLTDSTPVTRIIIPRLSVDSIVKYVPFSGKSWLIGGLKQEVAWMGDTAWPGLGGNTGLAGHVDLFDGSDGPFRYLYELEPGDEVILYTEKNMYFYKVRDQVVVKDDDLSVIDPTDDPQLTLITCTGWDDELRLYLQRLVVFSDLVEVKSITNPQATIPIGDLNGAATRPKAGKAAASETAGEPAAQSLIEYKQLADQLSSAGIDPSTPGRKAVFVDQQAQLLYLFHDGVPVRTLPISTGMAEFYTPSYTGYVKHFVGTINSDEGLLADQAWYLFTNTGRIYIHSAPYDLGADGKKNYVDLDLIGEKPASHGCIRLNPLDAEWFTSWNPEGAAIIISEPPEKIISP